MKEIEARTNDIQKLNQQLQQKQKDLVQMDSEVERFKIQISALNKHISDLECQILELKATKDKDQMMQHEKQLTEDLDFQKNLNKQQKLIIEKLGNKVLTYESKSNDNKQVEQQFDLERAQMQRKITSLEN